MVANATSPKSTGQMASTLLALVSNEGSMGHPHLKAQELRTGRNATRNLADAIHHLTMLHGRQPGVIDHAALHTTDPAVRGWLTKAIDGFARERNFLTRLTVAVGPLPSTPGQAETENAVLAQRHALEMLAQSDRHGCALGAAVALVLDWRAVREVLDLAAKRLSLDSHDSQLPSDEMTMGVLSAVGETPGIERAVTFGAHQLLNQHRGLWDLMAARYHARGDS